MKALVLPGGVAQIERIKQLKERGVTTVLADGSADALASPMRHDLLPDLQ